MPLEIGVLSKQGLGSFPLFLGKGVRKVSSMFTGQNHTSAWVPFYKNIYGGLLLDFYNEAFRNFNFISILKHVKITFVFKIGYKSFKGN